MANTYIFPAQRGLAAFTVDVSHSMKTSQQDPLLCRTAANVHTATTPTVTTAQFTLQQHPQLPQHHSHCYNTHSYHTTITTIQSATTPTVTTPSFTLQQHPQLPHHHHHRSLCNNTNSCHTTVTTIHSATTPTVATPPSPCISPSLTKLNIFSLPTSLKEFLLASDFPPN